MNGANASIATTSASGHSGLMFANLMTFAHFSTSAVMNF